MAKSNPTNDGSEERDADFSLLNENNDPGPAEEARAAAGEEVADEASVLRAELVETKEKYLRLLAEFDNFRKRVARERGELLKYQGESIVYDLLEVLDNLERALQHADADPSKFREGVELIYKRFTDILGKWDIKGESAIGKVFNPEVHQAISKVTIPGAENAVVEELKKPYFYKDKLLRAGEVVVAIPPEEENKESSESFDA